MEKDKTKGWGRKRKVFPAGEGAREHQLANGLILSECVCFMCVSVFKLGHYYLGEYYKVGWYNAPMHFYF